LVRASSECETYSFGLRWARLRGDSQTVGLLAKHSNGQSVLCAKRHSLCAAMAGTLMECWESTAQPRHPYNGLSEKVNTVMKAMTRTKLIQIWLAAVALVVAASFAFGMVVTVGTGAMLLALCLVPPTIVLFLWPGVPPPTAAEVLHGVDRRD
jgi:hypothetical protein